MQEEFAEVFAEGLIADMVAGKPRLDESCAIFKLPNQKPIAVAKVGGDASGLSINNYSPQVSSEAFFGDRQGILEFGILQKVN